MTKLNKGFYLIPFLILLISCRTAPVQEASIIAPDIYYASDLYHDVQLAQLYPDSKTFADAVPKRAITTIIETYKLEKDKPDFDLRRFVENNYEIPGAFQASFQSDSLKSMEEHIASLWPELTRTPDQNNPHASLLPLPQNYIVPGGRFREIYYWDSYFTLEGLLLYNAALAEEMVDNFAFLIDSLGFIPNGNRNYYLTRSQPPFFSLMVDAIARKDEGKLQKYLPQMMKEHEYWMQENKQVEIGGVVYNKYHDTGRTPRPESYREDFELAEGLSSENEKENLYSNLRTGAMSGWDYSTRWFADKQNLASIEINDIIPVDLNCLLYFMENLIAKAHEAAGNQALQEKYAELAKKRQENIQRLFWNKEIQYFEDYNSTSKGHTGRITLAGAFPLFMGIATQEQAEGVMETLKSQFLQPGGFVTTLNNSGQQWDAPNGWAPLQWVCIQGLQNYGYEDMARDAANRWLHINRKVYKNTGKMMEKYNVMDTTLVGGGGEYPNQDGFGWTNGVAVALLEMLKRAE